MTHTPYRDMTNAQYCERRILRVAKRRGGNPGRAAVRAALGCTIDEFVTHMEAQFEPEMSWANRGAYWHFDHRHPLALFPSEYKMLGFHFTNYQPLEGRANLGKECAYDPRGTFAKQGRSRSVVRAILHRPFLAHCPPR